MKKKGTTTTTNMTGLSVLAAAAAGGGGGGGGDPLVKIDQRGGHWREKVLRGEAPKPWLHNRLWSQRLLELEEELRQALLFSSVLKPSPLPWRHAAAAIMSAESENPKREGGGGGGGGTTTRVRSTGRALYVQLLLHEQRGVIVLHRLPRRGGGGGYEEEDSSSFWSIVGVSVPSDQRAAFDAGIVPSIECAKANERALRLSSATTSTTTTTTAMRTMMRVKTAQKIWQTVGLRERVCRINGTLAYEYDEALFQRMQAQMRRAVVGVGGQTLR